MHTRESLEASFLTGPISFAVNVFLPAWRMLKGGGAGDGGATMMMQGTEAQAFMAEARAAGMVEDFIGVEGEGRDVVSSVGGGGVGARGNGKRLRR